MKEHSKASLDRYKKILEERYEILLSELDGRPSPNYESDQHGNDWEDFDREYEECKRKEYGESYRLVDGLNLRLAADDFMNVLKEIKKLK